MYKLTLGARVTTRRIKSFVRIEKATQTESYSLSVRQKIFFSDSEKRITMILISGVQKSEIDTKKHTSSEAKYKIGSTMIMGTLFTQATFEVKANFL